MAQAKPLTPAMQRVMRAVEEYGHFDPIRDGRHTNTVVALMDRGLLREAKRAHGVHFPATTPDQVWDEAHTENTRRDDERKAHAEMADEIEALEVGPIVIHVDAAQLRAAEMRKAESAQIRQDIRDGNYTIVMGEPINADGTPHVPWTPTTGETVLYRDSNPRRALGRILLVDGVDIKVQWPGGVDWHKAHELEYHPMPSDKTMQALADRVNELRKERMTIDPAVGPDYTGGAFTEAMHAARTSRYTSPVGGMALLGPEVGAILADVAALRRTLEPIVPLGATMREVGDRLDRIEATLRAAGA